MYIHDTAGDNWLGLHVQENEAGTNTAQDTCHFATCTVPLFPGIPPNAPMWTVGVGAATGIPNTFTWDHVGWSTKAVDYYRVQAPQHGIAVPCGFTAYQTMSIQCTSGAYAPYTPSFGNKLTATIEQTDVINCRYDMDNTACQTIKY
jgi:hypothetical protein